MFGVSVVHKLYLIIKKTKRLNKQSFGVLKKYKGQTMDLFPC